MRGERGSVDGAAALRAARENRIAQRRDPAVAGDHQRGIELRERHQHEEPLVQARMGQREASGRDHPIIDEQHITTAAALDTRDYRARDPRCTEGPIPVQCRSCSCGTCWIGVLGGAEKLSPVDAQERATVAALGYSQSDEANPVIRLACMAEVHGSISIVIPPWNGQVGVRLQRAGRDA